MTTIIVPAWLVWTFIVMCGLQVVLAVAAVVLNRLIDRENKKLARLMSQIGQGD